MSQKCHFWLPPSLSCLAFLEILRRAGTEQCRELNEFKWWSWDSGFKFLYFLLEIEGQSVCVCIIKVSLIVNIFD